MTQRTHCDYCNMILNCVGVQVSWGYGSVLHDCDPDNHFCHEGCLMKWLEDDRESITNAISKPI